MQSSQSWDPNLYQSAHAFVWQKAAGLIDLLAPQPGECILDLGCGTGQLTAQLAERGADVIGIDRSTDMIVQAKQNFPDLKFQVGDATTFTLQKPVDAVFSNATLHWVKPPGDAVAQIWTALRPGGRFVAEFGGKRNVERIVQAMRSAIPAFDELNPWYYPSVAEYAGLLEQQGFEVNVATLFDRPTPLEGGDAGLRNWVRMFGSSFFERIAAEQREAVLDAIEAHAWPTLYRDGQWTADYVWLRIAARRPIAD